MSSAEPCPTEEKSTGVPIVSAAALGIATSATGLVRTRTTALMTAEEVDRALEKTVNYRAPGR